MWLLLLSLIVAIVAGLGRQIAVFAKVKKGLWLFSNWRRLRLVLTSVSMVLAVAGYLIAPSGGGLALFLLIIFLNAFSYFFEMPFFFPEVNQVERIPAAQTAVAADTEVIGISVGDTSVAYPINEIVMPRHIVHDTIGLYTNSRGRHQVSPCSTKTCRRKLSKSRNPKARLMMPRMARLMPSTKPWVMRSSK